MHGSNRVEGGKEEEVTMHEAARQVREQELMRLLLAGYMMKECAALMKMSYKTVRDYARQPEFLVQLKELSREVYERVDAELRNLKEPLLMKLEEASAEALDRMIELMKHSKQEGVAFKAAQDLLDRTPELSRTRKLEGSVTSRHQFLDPLMLVHAAATAKEMDQFEARKQLTEGRPPTGDDGAIPPVDATS